MPRFASVAAGLLVVSAIFSAGYHVGHSIASKYHVWVTALLGLTNIALAAAGGLNAVILRRQARIHRELMKEIQGLIRLRASLKQGLQ